MCLVRKIATSIQFPQAIGFFRLSDWTELTKEQRRILRGLDCKEGTWGLLGETRRLDHDACAFKNEPPENSANILNEIYGVLRPVMEARDDSVAETAQNILDKIRGANGIKGMGPALATRLLALARPDRLVSVNSKSAKGLLLLFYGKDNFTNERRVKYLADNYSELLEMIYGSSWFKQECPDDSLERSIWNYRTALLDAFVYEDLNDWIR